LRNSVLNYGNDSDKGHELYDLSKDSGELTNLAKPHPEVTQRLAAALEKAEADGRTRR
jgi:hypothetical protein